MKSVAVVIAWLLIGFGVGMMARAIFILGHPKDKEDYE